MLRGYDTRQRRIVFDVCGARAQFGQRSYAMPSRFLDDMGYKIAAFGMERPAQPVTDDIDLYNLYDIGDGVRSPQFGVGEVIDVDGLAVSVRFENGTTKKLNTQFANLQKYSLITYKT